MGLERAVKNTHDGVSLVNTAESNLNEIRNMVLRMREIAVQMANGIYSDNPDRSYAQLEIDQLLQQIDLIAVHANFNGVKLLDGTFKVSASKQGQLGMNGPVYFLETTPQLV